MKRSLKLALRLLAIPVLTINYGYIWALLYIMVYGLYALSLVIYKSVTFNDCRSAADSLKQEIVEARIGLVKKGFNFAVQ